MALRAGRAWCAPRRARVRFHAVRGGGWRGYDIPDGRMLPAASPFLP